MSSFDEEIDTLQEDANFEQPLRRVDYQAGMLLGLEATRDEQSYHRRRLNRHQYWLQGYGTVAGLVVAIEPPPSTTTLEDFAPTRLTVSPGIGIDGLGREVLVHEAYGIDLSDWLKTKTLAQLEEGYRDSKLWLKVTLRYQEVPVGLQPVLARKLNLSTDAVQPSRMADSILLELIPELPPVVEAHNEHYQPWAVHDPVGDARPAQLTATETQYIQNTSNTNLAAQLELHARLLHGLGNSGLTAQLAADELEAGSRILLARLAIPLASLNTIINAGEQQQVVQPKQVEVNNLVRPFVVTASQLSRLLIEP